MVLVLELFLLCIRSDLDGSGTGTGGSSYSVSGLVWMVLVLELVDPLTLYQVWSGWFWYWNWWILLFWKGPKLSRCSLLQPGTFIYILEGLLHMFFSETKKPLTFVHYIFHIFLGFQPTYLHDC
jgi:hypothetical protein